MPNRKVVVKEIFYNVCRGGIRRVTLKKKKRGGETPSKVFMKVTILLH